MIIGKRKEEVEVSTLLLHENQKKPNALRKQIDIISEPKKSLCLSLDLNPACPDRMASLNHLSNHHHPFLLNVFITSVSILTTISCSRTEKLLDPELKTSCSVRRLLSQKVTKTHFEARTQFYEKRFYCKQHSSIQYQTLLNLL